MSEMFRLESLRLSQVDRYMSQVELKQTRYYYYLCSNHYMVVHMKTKTEEDFQVLRNNPALVNPLECRACDPAFGNLTSKLLKIKEMSKFKSLNESNPK